MDSVKTKKNIGKDACRPLHCRPDSYYDESCFDLASGDDFFAIHGSPFTIHCLLPLKAVENG